MANRPALRPAMTLRQLLGPMARDYAEGKMRIPAHALTRIEWRAEPGEWCYTHGEHFRHTFPRGAKEKKRLARLHISSYTEIGSAGASHWYASIRADVTVSYREGDRIVNRSGFLGEAAPREWAEDIKLEIRRAIKSRERDAWGRRIGKAGEMTRRLDSKEQAFALALATFKRRFGPGWMLVDDRNDDAILAET